MQRTEPSPGWVKLVRYFAANLIERITQSGLPASYVPIVLMHSVLRVVKGLQNGDKWAGTALG